MLARLFINTVTPQVSGKDGGSHRVIYQAVWAFWETKNWWHGRLTLLLIIYMAWLCWNLAIACLIQWMRWNYILSIHLFILQHWSKSQCLHTKVFWVNGPPFPRIMSSILLSITRSSIKLLHIFRKWVLFPHHLAALEFGACELPL